MLPTGFGKTLCYGVLPLAFDRLENQEEEGAIVVIATPLTAIMKDQVFKSLSLSSKEIIDPSLFPRLPVSVSKVPQLHM